MVYVELTIGSYSSIYFTCRPAYSSLIHSVAFTTLCISPQSFETYRAHAIAGCRSQREPLARCARRDRHRCTARTICSGFVVRPSYAVGTHTVACGRRRRKSLARCARCDTFREACSSVVKFAERPGTTHRACRVRGRRTRPIPKASSAFGLGVRRASPVASGKCISRACAGAMRIRASSSSFQRFPDRARGC